MRMKVSVFWSVLLLLCVAGLQVSVVNSAGQQGGDAAAAVKKDESAGMKDESAAKNNESAAKNDVSAGKKDESAGNTDESAGKKDESAGKKDGSGVDEKRSRSKKATIKSKVVDFAPAVDVEFGDDIDPLGECAEEISHYCDDVEEGDGALADCVSDQISMVESVDEKNADHPHIQDECREYLYQFKISRNSNINKNTVLAKACKADADKFCNVTWFFGYKSGQVISCLRDVKKKVSKPCKKQLFRVQMDAAQDMRSDPTMWEACEADVKSLCDDVKPGGGRVQACLRDNMMKLSWGCEEQLYRVEMENADDIRLSVRLWSSCLPDKRKFCQDVPPGNAQTKDCLEQNLDELSTACKAEFDSLLERRVKDFRLDSKLRGSCEKEIQNLCAYFGDVEDIDMHDTSVVKCLQDYSEEIKNAKCMNEVKKYTVMASQDIRFNIPLAEACFSDRQKFCAKVPPGSARVIRCLMKEREKLEPHCRATLFDEEVRFSENIDFQFPMKQACTDEIKKYCKDIPHGDARVLRCLSEKKYDKDFGRACQKEVMEFEHNQAADYRLNFRLFRACSQTVDKLCPSACGSFTGGQPDQICGGKVLRCLTDKMDLISDAGCKQEVQYFEKMEVTDFNNDVLLAEACRADVQLYCLKVEPGEGRVHACLRENRKKLSEPCRKEELALEEREAETVELSVGLLKACKAERALYCKSVATGSARVFRCLAQHLNDPDFGSKCKFQVVYKLQRRQANWKMDPTLRKACRDDVSAQCSAEDAQVSEEGLVYKCLIKAHDSLSGACQKEVSRAVHMAFFVFQKGSIMTASCDTEVEKYCLAVRPSMDKTPGAVTSCLTGILRRQQARGEVPEDERRMLAAAVTDSDTPERAPLQVMKGAKLSSECFALVDVAEPPDAKAAFDSSLSFALLSQIGKVGSSSGVRLLVRDRTGRPQTLSLTGWSAMLGMAAMMAIMVVACVAFYKHMVAVQESKARSHGVALKVLPTKSSDATLPGPGDLKVLGHRPKKSGVRVRP